jgi:hypothetical protein
MVEAKPTKYYLAKYFFLAFGALQWLVAAILILTNQGHGKIYFAALLFFTLGLVSIFIFMLVTDKIRRVAIGKNKIVVIEGRRNLRFEWPEVKSLKVIPFFNVYRLKIKGKKSVIYFFPSRAIDPAYGGLLSEDTSKMGEIVRKAKKEYGFK